MPLALMPPVILPDRTGHGPSPLPMTDPNTPPHVNHRDFSHQGKRYTLGHLNGFDHSFPTRRSSDLKLLSDVLKSLHCRLEILRSVIRHTWNQTGTHRTC